MADIPIISPELFDEALQIILQMYTLQKNEKIDELTEAAVKKLVRLTKSNAPRGDREKNVARPRFHTSIASKRLDSSFLGASRFLWYVNAPNYRLTHLLARAHRTKDGRILAPNPFLQNALQQVLQGYEKSIQEEFGV